MRSMQDRLAALGAGIPEFCIARIKTLGHGKRRHEVAPDIANKPLHLAFIIAFARPAKTVFKQIMALQLGKHLRAQPQTTLHDLGYGKLGVIVEDRLGHAAKISKCRDMAITEGFSRLSWIGFDKAAIRMWKIHAKVMVPDLLAADIAIGFAKIHLCLTCNMAERDKQDVLQPRQRRCRPCAAKATVILAIVKDEPDITLEELQGLLRNRAQPYVGANNRTVKLRQCLPPFESCRNCPALIFLQWTEEGCDIN